MSINEWMDKECVVYIYNGVLLSHKREHIWVSPNEIDEPRAYYTEWNTSERGKQLSYTNTYIWNLKRWYWWTYLQISNGGTNIENRFMDMLGGAGEGVRYGESNMKTYITICKIDSQWEFAVWLLTSQRHPEKLHEVTGTCRGNPGFPATMGKRPRESYFNVSWIPNLLP